jgi:hypothetical protein
VLLGVITPGWWWWRRDRGTDAPLRVMGLGAGLFGPICSLLALLGGLRNERPVSVTQPASPLLLRPPELPRAEALLAAPLPLSKGLGDMAGLALGATPTGWGPPAAAPEIRITRRGSRPPIWRTATPLSSRVGNVARIAVLRPRSLQSVVMSLGSIRDSGTKVSVVIPPPGVPARPRTDRYSTHVGSYRCRSGQ